jgi:hypothetical protein
MRVNTRMRMRDLINVVTEVEELDSLASGKFWYNVKTGKFYRVRGHHTLVAFQIPELSQVLRENIGEGNFDEFVQSTRDAAEAFFANDIGGEDAPYFKLHDKVCEILCNSGYIRGNNDWVLYLAFTSLYERAARELVVASTNKYVEIDIVDLKKNVSMSGADLDFFRRGRSLRAFLNKS